MLTLGFSLELSPPRTPEKLTYIANILLKNEETPLPPAPDDGIEYLNTFTGPNIRFESLGLIFVFFGRALFSLQDGDARFNLPELNGFNRKDIAWRMKKCVDTCLQMCEVSFNVPGCSAEFLQSRATTFTADKLREQALLLVRMGLTLGHVDSS